MNIEKFVGSFIWYDNYVLKSILRQKFIVFNNLAACHMLLQDLYINIITFSKSRYRKLKNQIIW